MDKPGESHMSHSEGKSTAGNSRTDRTRVAYDRISRIYDLMELRAERALFRHWRQRLFEMVEGRVLEVGVGTGKNIPHYSTGSSVFAIDLSARMMGYARRRARQAVVRPKLILMDAQHLGFREHTFDTIVATFVYCSVPDPVAGFEELNRVCKPDGRILLLEHVRSTGRIKGWLMDVLNPLVVKLMGFNINRDTVRNVKLALSVTGVDHLKGELFKRIRARPRA